MENRFHYENGSPMMNQLREYRPVWAGLKQQPYSSGMASSPRAFDPKKVLYP